VSPSAPTYAEVVAGMHERLATVTGIKACLTYEPTEVQQPPIIYSLLDTFERRQETQLTVMRYRILHRLVIATASVAKAEEQLAAYVNVIPAAIDADPQLGGRILSGLARIADAQAVWVKLGSQVYRCLDCYSDVLTKGAWKSGI
jgi:hypothetical protein